MPKILHRSTFGFELRTSSALRPLPRSLCACSGPAPRLPRFPSKPTRPSHAGKTSATVHGLMCWISAVPRISLDVSRCDLELLLSRARESQNHFQNPPDSPQNHPQNVPAEVHYRFQIDAYIWQVFAEQARFRFWTDHLTTFWRRAGVVVSF